MKGGGPWVSDEWWECVCVCVRVCWGEGALLEYEDHVDGVGVYVLGGGGAPGACSLCVCAPVLCSCLKPVCVHLPVLVCAVLCRLCCAGGRQYVPDLGRGGARGVQRAAVASRNRPAAAQAAGAVGRGGTWATCAWGWGGVYMGYMCMGGGRCTGSMCTCSPCTPPPHGYSTYYVG